MTRRARLAALPVAIAAAGLAAASASGAPIGPDAVFDPPAGFRSRVDAACAATPDRFFECFAGEMATAGATPAAVAFTRLLGSPAYAVAFHDAGRVDVVDVESPFRANENAMVYLVNGEPPAIDVDDVSRVETAELEGYKAYSGLRRAFPRLALFPGDRGPGHPPRATSTRAGGQRFVVVYALRDGCHACKTVGYARIAFDFDAAGRFAGTEVVGVRPQYK